MVATDAILVGGCSSRVGNASDGIFENSQSLLELLIGNVERHQYAHHVIVHTGADQHQTTLVSCAENGSSALRVWLFTLAVFDQFHCDHATQTAHVADEIVTCLEAGKCVENGLANLP